jgi:hypothetical protein
VEAIGECSLGSPWDDEAYSRVLQAHIPCTPLAKK